jgi:hypothetical protein
MRVPLIQDAQVREGPGHRGRLLRPLRVACAQRAPARTDSRLIRLPIKVEAGQVTYVYGEPDQPPDAGA